MTGCAGSMLPAAAEVGPRLAAFCVLLLARPFRKGAHNLGFRVFGPGGFPGRSPGFRDQNPWIPSPKTIDEILMEKIDEKLMKNTLFSYCLTLWRPNFINFKFNEILMKNEVF